MAISGSSTTTASGGDPVDAPAGRGTGAAGAQTLAQRAVLGAHAAVDSVARKVESAVDLFKSKAADTAESVTDGAERLASAEQQAVETVRTAVREHPLLLLGVALAGGIVIGRLWSR
ncbi:MAG: hypothetical protein K2Y35_20180 [Burkholderiales bacterium]|nr:hypothetical protein [Burkholderiales bacterium]